MKFMMTFAWTPDTEMRTEGIKRFQDTGGQPPEEYSSSADGLGLT